MKRFFFCIVLMALIIGSGSAEELYHWWKLGLQSSATALITDAQSADKSYIPQFNIGATIHIVPWLVLRPQIEFISSSSTNQDVYNSYPKFKDRERSGFGWGCDGLIFIPMNGNIALYLGAGLDFLSSKESQYGQGGGWPFTVYKSRESTFNQSTFSAIIGVQYLFNANFGFFTEMGIDWNTITCHSTSWDAGGNPSAESNTENFYSNFRLPTIGAIFYFN